MKSVMGIARAALRALRRLLWGTEQRRWTVGGLVVGWLVGLCLPGMGLSMLGGATNIWGWAVLGFTVIGGIIGNRIGIGREKTSPGKKR